MFKTKVLDVKNSVDPDTVVHYKPVHLDLHCLHIHIFLFVALEVLCRVADKRRY